LKFKEDLLTLVKDVIQFDWCDFFLFKEFPENWKNSKKAPYSNIVVQSDTTIRLVDDTYIYIYTPILDIKDNICGFYNVESVKEGNIVRNNTLSTK